MPWKPKFDWEEIQRYHEQGHSVRECAQTYGFTVGGWYKARARGLVRTVSHPKYHPKYNWDEIQAYYDLGNSWAVCREYFGFGGRTWQKARDRGAIRSRPVLKPLEILLRAGNRSAIKRRLLKEGILKNECSRCGISEWRGKPLSIQIDHINGINDDYRLENLRMLCPNCHSLTPTHGRRNVGKRLSALILPWQLIPSAYSPLATA
ncbi:MAG TPA: HNH endonuclease signature motif containing protein [Candidatus Rubrimentiphilum sp.]|nr:HNH endonuclease signature motif containing protein [Candidatus Rubrimentiphilum sp.]